MTEWLTVSDIEKQTGIPDATVRRYIRNYGHHFKIKKNGKSYMVASESVEIMKQIREWYVEGKQTSQIDEKLAQAGIPMTVTVTDDEEEMIVNVAEVLKQQGEALQVMQRGMTEMNNKHDELVDIIKAQQEYIDQKMESRDQKIIEVMRGMQESKKQIAASEEKEEKKGFWQKLFKF